MSALELLAEARIREWLARPKEERAARELSYDAAAPLELQLMADVLALDRHAAAIVDDDERRAITDKADALMLRVLVLLERDGRPLAAQHFAERRAAALRERRS